MDFFSPEFFTALLSVVVIDLVLAGDNAIVIGLIARNLPSHQQKPAIIWGTLGAIIIRVIATLTVVWLLKIPGLMVGGGILLVWIAGKLLYDEKCHDVKECDNYWTAVRDIIIADGVMGIDNVMGVAGASHGNFTLVIIGLAISVPIMVWGSTIIVKLTERFPVIIMAGAGILGWTAAKMIMEEQLLTTYFHTFPVLKIALILGIACILFFKKTYNYCAVKFSGTT